MTVADEKFDPIKEFTSIRDTLSKAVEQSVKGMVGVSNIQVDVIETADYLIVRTSPIDGAKPESLEVSVESGILTISGETAADTDVAEGSTYLLRERKFGAFSRAVKLQRPVKSDEAQAKFKHGTLTITFPKIIDTRPQIVEVTPAE
jgi:HSP20 family protein